MEEKSMSSVNSASDRSNAEETIQRARDNYKERETDETKKHGQELKKITQAHQAELDQLRNEHAHEMEELKSRSKDAISRRDMQYQRDIDELRDIHQKQLTKTTSDAENRIQKTEEAVKGESDRYKSITERQKDLLRTEYEGELKERDQKLEDFSKESQHKMQTQNQETGKRLTSQYQTDLQSVVKDRDRRLGQAQTDYYTLDQTKNKEMKDVLNSTNKTVERTQKNFEVGVLNERQDHKAAEDVERQGFEDAAHQNRQRYEKALEKNRDEMESARGQLVDTVDGRLNTQVSSLKAQLNKIKNDSARERMNNQQQKNREIANVQEAYQKNLDLSEKNRKDFVQDANQKRAMTAGRQNALNEEAMTRNQRFYKEKLAFNELDAENRVGTLVNERNGEKAHDEATSTSRFKRLQSFNEIEQAKQRAYFENASKGMRENFENTLDQMRLNNKQEQDKIINEFSKQSQESDKAFQAKLGDITVKYEHEIAEMNEKHTKELKETQMAADRRLKEQIKKDTGEMDAANAQSQYRLSKTEETHKHDLNEIQHKHQEALANLAKSRQS
jgi:hypothetical protein